MALGRRKSQQQEMFIPTSALPRSPGHPFYEALNKLLKDAKFDTYVEGLCEPLYKEGGRPSIPPGVFFRMLFIGYFEGIDSQRGMAWRCTDSLSLRSFLGLSATATSPDHSSLTVIRRRLPKELIDQVFSFVLGIAAAKKLVKGSKVGVDATTLEANFAMKSIVRQDTDDTWKEYLTKLAKAEGSDRCGASCAETERIDEQRALGRSSKGQARCLRHTLATARGSSSLTPLRGAARHDRRRDLLDRALLLHRVGRLGVCLCVEHAAAPFDRDLVREHSAEKDNGARVVGPAQKHDE